MELVKTTKNPIQIKIITFGTENLGVKAYIIKTGFKFSYLII